MTRRKSLRRRAQPMVVNVSPDEAKVVRGLAESLGHLFLRRGVCPRPFTSLHATGYPSGRYGSQRWHQQESGLAGPPLRSQLQKVVRG